MFTAKEASEMSSNAFTENSPVIAALELRIKSEAWKGNHSLITHALSGLVYTDEQIMALRAVLARNGYLTEYNKEKDYTVISW